MNDEWSELGDEIAEERRMRAQEIEQEMRAARKDYIFEESKEDILSRWYKNRNDAEDALGSQLSRAWDKYCKDAFDFSQQANPNPDRAIWQQTLARSIDMSETHTVQNRRVYVDTSGDVRLDQMSIDQILKMIKKHKEIIKELEDYDSEALKTDVMQARVKRHGDVIQAFRDELSQRSAED